MPQSKRHVAACVARGAAYEHHSIDGTLSLQHEITVADATEALDIGLAAALSGKRFDFRRNLRPRRGHRLGRGIPLSVEPNWALLGAVAAHVGR